MKRRILNFAAAILLLVVPVYASQTWTDNTYQSDHTAATDLQAIENNFAALKTNFSGTSAPSGPSGLMWWADTANNLLKLRDEANNAWLEIYDFGNDRVGTGKVKTDSLDSGAVTDVKVTSVGGSKITAGSIPSGKFQAGAIAGADIADGAVARAKIGSYTAGDYIIVGSDAEKTTTATSYTRVKEIVVTRTGTLRVKFDLASGSAGINAYGRVYRNGVAVGTARNTTSVTPTTYTEDISGWSPNDLCQVYAYTQSGSYATRITNFRLYTGAPEREYVTLD